MSNQSIISDLVGFAKTHDCETLSSDEIDALIIVYGLDGVESPEILSSLRAYAAACEDAGEAAQVVALSDSLRYALGV